MILGVGESQVNQQRKNKEAPTIETPCTARKKDTFQFRKSGRIVSTSRELFGVSTRIWNVSSVPGASAPPQTQRLPVRLMSYNIPSGHVKSTGAAWHTWHL